VQVNPSSLLDAAVLNSYTGGLLLSAQHGSFEPLLRVEAQGLCGPTPDEDERDAEAVAAQVPVRPVDVINEAERNVEGSSRAFHRQVAREGATDQFRESRQALRQAWQEEGAEPASRGSRTTGTGSATQADLKSDPRRNAAAVIRARFTGTGSAETGTTKTATGSAGVRVMAAASSARAATSSGPALAHQGAGTAVTTASVLNAAAGRGLPGFLAGVRGAASSQAASMKPGAAGGIKGAPPATNASFATRGSPRGEALTGAKANRSQAAENADRMANIERIVRMVAQRIRGERSHTVMRLDPPELGSLRLQLDLKGEVLALRIDTTTQLAHRLLSEDVDRLRHGLEASGIQLERIEVRPPTQGPQAGEPGAADQGPAQEGSGETDAEHPEDHGRDSHPARSPELATGGSDSEPATESLVNVIA
jgi:flagellar hook-length control protein FliK